MSCFCVLFSIPRGLPLPLKGPALALFDFVLVQDFLLHSLSQLLPAQVHLALVQTSPSFHILRVFLHSDNWPVLHFFSRPSWYSLLCFGVLHSLILQHSFSYHQLRCFSFDIQLQGASLHSSSLNNFFQMLFLFPLFCHFGRLLASFPLLLLSQSANNPILYGGLALAFFQGHLLGAFNYSFNNFVFLLPLFASFAFFSFFPSFLFRASAW